MRHFFLDEYNKIRVYHKAFVRARDSLAFFRGAAANSDDVIAPRDVIGTPFIRRADLIASSGRRPKQIDGNGRWRTEPITLNTGSAHFKESPSIGSRGRRFFGTSARDFLCAVTWSNRRTHARRKAEGAFDTSAFGSSDDGGVPSPRPMNLWWPDAERTRRDAKWRRYASVRRPRLILSTGVAPITVTQPPWRPPHFAMNIW